MQTDPAWSPASEKLPPSLGVAWLETLRKNALSRFSALGYPTLKDESWRNTNIEPILKTSFVSRAVLEKAALEEKARALLPASLSPLRLVFINGLWSEALSICSPQYSAVQVIPLAEALTKNPRVLEANLAGQASVDESAFTALNTALWQDGALVLIGSGVVLSDPVELVFLHVGENEPVISHPRVLVRLQAQAQATLIERYIGELGHKGFANAVLEAVLEEGAVLDHYTLHSHSPESYHIATQAVHLGRACQYNSHVVSWEGALIRNALNVRLVGEGSECLLDGLFMTRQKQLIDHHTLIEHAKPHCRSREEYRGVLDGQGRGVFSGRIVVRPDAQKTDAMQLNKNLLLSQEALIDSLPELEIYADDVRCKHGSTTGQLDESVLFYLRSRGISLAQARQMLTRAFAADVLDRIKPQPLRAEMDAVLERQFAGANFSR